jgi:hypothetical protein
MYDRAKEYRRNYIEIARETLSIYETILNYL